MRAAVVSMLFGAASAGVVLPLVTFDGQKGTTFNFKQMNDPVMGGESTGNWSVQTKDQQTFGVMDGVVVNVPKLAAPGFIESAADAKFNDVSAALSGGLRLTVRSSTPEYKGFRVSFAAGTLSPDYSCAGGGSIPFSRGCFKRPFSVKAGSEFSTVYLPFNTFSDKWSPATGVQNVTCSEDSDVCPTAKDLAGIVRVEFWAEGAAGKVHLEVLRVDAVSGAEALSLTAGGPPPADQDTCSGAVQGSLRYGVSGRTSPAGVNAPVDQSESLAEAVCCDKRAILVAEPQFLYEAPDVLLFSKLDASGVTTFYDSVCGLPLFKSPVNRTIADFKADTTEHGWPSFRPAEVVTENVVTDKDTKLVKSKCGTHLGTFLPDAMGDRWCI
eukprot:Hpha_TRINITY_DN16879_c1_g1::TRINITY_DN16879_c1_g1_i14::g.151020::m.151020